MASTGGNISFCKVAVPVKQHHQQHFAEIDPLYEHEICNIKFAKITTKNMEQFGIIGLNPFNPRKNELPKPKTGRSRPNHVRMSCIQLHNTSCKLKAQQQNKIFATNTTTNDLYSKRTKNVRQREIKFPRHLMRMKFDYIDQNAQKNKTSKKPHRGQKLTFTNQQTQREIRPPKINREPKPTKEPRKVVPKEFLDCPMLKRANHDTIGREILKTTEIVEVRDDRDEIVEIREDRDETVELLKTTEIIELLKTTEIIEILKTTEIVEIRDDGDEIAKCLTSIIQDVEILEKLRKVTTKSHLLGGSTVKKPKQKARSKPEEESSSEDDEESEKNPEPVIVLLDEKTIKNSTFEKLEYYSKLPNYSPHRSVPEALTVQSRPLLEEEINYRTKEYSRGTRGPMYGDVVPTLSTYKLEERGNKRNKPDATDISAMKFSPLMGEIKSDDLFSKNIAVKKFKAEYAVPTLVKKEKHFVFSGEVVKYLRRKYTPPLEVEALMGRFLSMRDPNSPNNYEMFVEIFWFEKNVYCWKLIEIQELAGDVVKFCNICPELTAECFKNTRLQNEWKQTERKNWEKRCNELIEQHREHAATASKQAMDTAEDELNKTLNNTTLNDNGLYCTVHGFANEMPCQDCQDPSCGECLLKRICLTCRQNLCSDCFSYHIANKCIRDGKILQIRRDFIKQIEEPAEDLDLSLLDPTFVENGEVHEPIIEDDAEGVFEIPNCQLRSIDGKDIGTVLSTDVDKHYIKRTVAKDDMEKIEEEEKFKVHFINDQSISSNHGYFKWDDEKAKMTYVATSANRSLVNGEYLNLNEVTVLENNDKLQLGNLVFMFNSHIPKIFTSTSSMKIANLLDEYEGEIPLPASTKKREHLGKIDEEDEMKEAETEDEEDIEASEKDKQELQHDLSHHQLLESGRFATVQCKMCKKIMKNYHYNLTEHVVTCPKYMDTFGEFGHALLVESLHEKCMGMEDLIKMAEYEYDKKRAEILKSPKKVFPTTYKYFKPEYLENDPNKTAILYYTGGIDEEKTEDWRMEYSAMKYNTVATSKKNVNAPAQARNRVLVNYPEILNKINQNCGKAIGQKLENIKVIRKFNYIGEHRVQKRTSKENVKKAFVDRQSINGHLMKEYMYLKFVPAYFSWNTKLMDYDQFELCSNGSWENYSTFCESTPILETRYSTVSGPFHIIRILESAAIHVINRTFSANLIDDMTFGAKMLDPDVFVQIGVEVVKYLTQKGDTLMHNPIQFAFNTTYVHNCGARDSHYRLNGFKDPDEGKNLTIRTSKIIDILEEFKQDAKYSFMIKMEHQRSLSKHTRIMLGYNYVLVRWMQEHCEMKLKGIRISKVANAKKIRRCLESQLWNGSHFTNFVTFEFRTVDKGYKAEENPESFETFFDGFIFIESGGELRIRCPCCKQISLNEANLSRHFARKHGTTHPDGLDITETCSECGAQVVACFMTEHLRGLCYKADIREIHHGMKALRFATKRPNGTDYRKKRSNGPANVHRYL